MPVDCRARLRRPIRITGGFATAAGLSGGGEITLQGTRGFSLTGTLTSGEGRNDPFSECLPYNLTPVPEPGTLLLVGGGLVAIARSARKRKASR